MSNTTTPVTTAAPKQLTCGINHAEKELVKLLAKELTRPAAVKGAPDVPASEREVLEMALKIATDRRHVEVDCEEEFLDVRFAANGVDLEEFKNTRPGKKVIDLFEESWEEIKLRDYSSPGTRVTKVATLQSQLAEAEAKMAAMMAAMAAAGVTTPVAGA